MMIEKIRIKYAEPDDNNRGSGIYLHDSKGEIVCWVDDEWIEDPSIVLTIVGAVQMGLTEGAAAMRKLLKCPKPVKESVDA